jgi:hypothetical protein
LFKSRAVTPHERPRILMTYEKFTPTFPQRRDERISAQYFSERARTTAIAPCLDELLNRVEQLWIVLDPHSRTNSRKSRELIAAFSPSSTGI